MRITMELEFGVDLKNLAIEMWLKHKMKTKTH